MSESSEGMSPVEQPKSAGLFRNFRERFFGDRSDKSVSTAGVAAAENNSVAVGIEFKFRRDNLRPAEPLFFHTAPTESSDSIKRDGLFSDAEDPNIGRGIGYSIFFGFERDVLRKNNHAKDNPNLDINAETPDDYVLTLWKTGPDLKRARNAHSKQFIDIRTQPNTISEIPEGFIKNSPMGEILRTAPQDVRKLDSGYFIAAVPLNRTVREEILKAMISAEDGRMTADQIEQNLLGVLERQNVILRDGNGLVDLVHQMTVSIEKDLMRYGVASSLKQAEVQPQPLLWKALVYRNNSNDPVTAKYLDKVIDKLIKVIRQKDSPPEYKSAEVLQKLHKDLEGLQKGDEVPPIEPATKIDYYGLDVTQIAARRLRQKMNLLAAA